jgi:ornithine cyclodeaminase/alanine dehydrogenase-like protein (mu-crystallin family)
MRRAAPDFTLKDLDGQTAKRSPDGQGGLINSVGAALDDLAAGHAVKTPETKASGCSVQYGS